MTMPIVLLILGMMFLRLTLGGSRRRWRQEHDPVLEDKVTKLEALVADLQEQLEQDRIALTRLEEERAFLAQLYPAKAEQHAS